MLITIPLLCITRVNKWTIYREAYTVPWDIYLLMHIAMILKNKATAS